VLLVLAVWTFWRSANYLAATGATERRHVESAWFVFIGAILITAVARTSITKALAPTVRAAPELALDAGLIAAAFLLYWPALGVGLLSDDYVLHSMASRGALLDPSWEYRRPLPLALWWLIEAAAPDAVVPIALHGLNVLLHAINARLVMVLAHMLRGNPRRDLIAGALFLMTPLVEPVVWLSGIFDVLLLTCCLCLTASLTMTSRWKIPVAIASAVAAVLTKETGVVAAVLAGLVLAARRDLWTRSNILAVGVSLSIGAAYALARLAMGVPDEQLAGVSGYELKEMLVRPFATLAIPTRAGIARVLAPFFVASVACLIVCLVWSAHHWHRRHADFIVVVALCGWILASIAPLSRMFFVDANLEGARYLYLASAAWAIVLSVVMVPVTEGRIPHAAMAMVAIVMLPSAFLVRAHLAPWHAAAALRDDVIESYRAVRGSCATVAVEGLPGSVAGAYVFRNGFEEAVGESPAPPDAACVFEWRDDGFHRLR
jgi:hypothetical protein